MAHERDPLEPHEQGDAAGWEPPAEPRVDAGAAGSLAQPPVWAHQIEEIVQAAERSAEEVRDHAEQRAQDRIAEAQRAADMRAAAAEDEAQEILAQAAAEAGKTAEAARAEALRLRSEADVYARELRESAEDDATQIREAAEADAREAIRAARTAADSVLTDGSQLSEDLRALSTSLHKNAERLLRDVSMAHRTLTADLDRAVGTAREEPPAGGRAPRSARVEDEPEIPEFIPRR